MISQQQAYAKLFKNAQKKKDFTRSDLLQNNKTESYRRAWEDLLLNGLLIPQINGRFRIKT